jgi:hypothetical protein
MKKDWVKLCHKGKRISLEEGGKKGGSISMPIGIPSG